MTPAYTVQGRTIALPVEVRDAVVIVASFVVPTGPVRRLLPPGLHAVELLPRRTLCVLAGIEYRDNDLGRYNEVAVSFFVKAGGPAPLPLLGLLGARRGNVGAYIHRLPVTTAFSCDAGRDIWGFPKTVEEIGFEDAGGRRTCRLVSAGVPVLTLTVRRGGRRRFADAAQPAFAWRDGVLWRTPTVMSGEGVGTRLGGAALTLGPHAIARELATLGLPRRALLSTSIECMRARFGPADALTGR